MSDKTIYFINRREIILSPNETKTYIIDTDTYKPLGYFSIQGVVTGDGVVTISYAVSNDPERNEFTDATEIFAGAVKDVTNFSTFEAPVCRYIKIIVKETSGTAVSVRPHLVAQ